MREIPQTFTAESIEGILAGRKTKTRRVVKPQPVYVDRPTVIRDLPVRCTFGPGWWARDYAVADTSARTIREALLDHSPYSVGDLIWVRETWRPRIANCLGDVIVTYAADGKEIFFDDCAIPNEWEMPKAAERGNVTPMYMPRWASRYMLRVTSVSAERLQDITVPEIEAEGIVVPPCAYDKVIERPDVLDFERECFARAQFVTRWDQINGRRASWESNPWVWALGIELAAVQADRKVS